jgi:uncharacterized protein (TIRG00374 family)
VTDGAQASATPDEAKPRFGKQQIIGLILTVLILVLVFAVVLPQFGDYDAAWDAIQAMEAWQLLTIAAATIAMILIYVLPYQAALPGIRYWPAFKVRQTSFMISNVVPMGGAFGLAVQYGMLQSYGFGAAPATATIGITSAWNTFVTLSLPVIALIALMFAGEATGEATTITVIAALIVVVAIVAFALILRSENLARKIGDVADGIISWAFGLFHKTSSVDATAGILNFRNSIIDVVKVRWLVITLANLGQQLAQFLILYLAVVALQGSWFDPIGPVEALAAFSFGRLATFIPIPPGGLGTTDALITAILGNFGLDNNNALAATMIWRAATYFPQVMIGAITLIAFRRDQNRARSEASSP